MSSPAKSDETAPLLAAPCSAPIRAPTDGSLAETGDWSLAEDGAAGDHAELGDPKPKKAPNMAIIFPAISIGVGLSSQATRYWVCLGVTRQLTIADISLCSGPDHSPGKLCYDFQRA